MIPALNYITANGWHWVVTMDCPSPPLPQHPPPFGTISPVVRKWHNSHRSPRSPEIMGQRCQSSEWGGSSADGGQQQPGSQPEKVTQPSNGCILSIRPLSHKTGSLEPPVRLSNWGWWGLCWQGGGGVVVVLMATQHRSTSLKPEMNRKTEV